MANLNFQQPPRSIANASLTGRTTGGFGGGSSLSGHVTPTSGMFPTGGANYGQTQQQQLSPNRNAQQLSVGGPALTSGARSGLFNQRAFVDRRTMQGLGGSPMSNMGNFMQAAGRSSYGGTGAGGGGGPLNNFHNVFGGGNGDAPALLDPSEFPSLTNARGQNDQTLPQTNPLQPPGSKPYGNFFTSFGMVKQPTAEQSEFTMSNEDFPALPGTQNSDGTTTAPGVGGATTNNSGLTGTENNLLESTDKSINSIVGGTSNGSGLGVGVGVGGVIGGLNSANTSVSNVSSTSSINNSITISSSNAASSLLGAVGSSAGNVSGLNSLSMSLSSGNISNCNLVGGSGGGLGIGSSNNGGNSINSGNSIMSNISGGNNSSVGSLNSGVGGNIGSLNSMGGLSGGSSGIVGSNSAASITGGVTTLGNIGGNSIEQQQQQQQQQQSDNSNNDCNKIVNMGVQTSPDGKVSNIPASMVNNQFGMVGLLTFIRAAESDPNLVTLALGTDLTGLGLNLNSQESLHPTFAGPFAEHPCRAQDVDYNVPPEYLINFAIRDKLASPVLKKLQDDLLFFLFYTNIGDIMQLMAAAELHSREWRYHIEEKIWITRIPGINQYEKNGTKERGTFYYFDAQSWKRLSKVFQIDAEKLDKCPNISAFMNGQSV